MNRSTVDSAVRELSRSDDSSTQLVAWGAALLFFAFVLLVRPYFAERIKKPHYPKSWRRSDQLDARIAVVVGIIGIVLVVVGGLMPG